MKSLEALHAERIRLEQRERVLKLRGNSDVLRAVRHELARVRRRISVLGCRRAGIVVVPTLRGLQVAGRS